MVDWLFKALCSLTAEVRSWFTLSINIIYYFRCSVLPRVLTGSHVIHLLWCSMIGDNNYNSRNIFLRYWGVFRWVVVVLEVDKMVSKDLVWAGRARKGWWWGAGSESCQGQSVLVECVWTMASSCHGRWSLLWLRQYRGNPHNILCHHLYSGPAISATMFLCHSFRTSLIVI